MTPPWVLKSPVNIGTEDANVAIPCDGGQSYESFTENGRLIALARESVHDDGCATMYPGGVCNCTKQAIRTGQTYPDIPMGGAMTVHPKGGAA